jgi:4'-phosphopantetheinyl transferase
LQLAPDEVHVWRARLDLVAYEEGRLEPLLSADELRRLRSIRSERGRRQYAVCRALLRTLAARYVGTSAASIRFRHGPNGKPQLAGFAALEDVRFNLSHSGEVALLVFARGREVGVDVERARPRRRPRRLAARLLSPSEAATPGKLGDRRVDLYSLWTAKEACLKATGEGLWASPRSVQVAIGPDGIGSAGEDPRARRWALRELTPASGYAGALAVEGRCWRLRRWECPRELP